MKKILAVLWICALCLGLLLYSIMDTPAQLQNPEPAQTEQTPTTDSNQPATKPSEQPPSQPEDDPPASQSAQIRILKPDWANQAVWEQLAKDYQEATGVQVVILDGSEDTVPTLYTVTDPTSVDPAECQDLSGTRALTQLADMELALTVDGKYCGLAAEVDCFGLIFNENLLAEVATPQEITDIESLSAVVQNLAAKGYTVFAGRGLNDGVAARLASLPGNFRSFAKLWVANSSREDSGAMERFLMGQAVFYLGSTAEYEDIIAGGIQAVGILPVYLDTDPDNYKQQSLCVTAKSYWCVAANGPAEDVAATLAFLDWLVVPGEDGQTPVDSLEILAPYRQAAYYGNPMEATLRQDLLVGKGYLVCENLTTPPEGFVDALTAYAQNPTDENWDLVEATLA